MQVYDVDFARNMGFRDPVAEVARINALPGSISAAKAIPDRVCVFGETWKVMFAMPDGACFGVNVGHQGWTSDDHLGLICDRWRAKPECSPVSSTRLDTEPMENDGTLFAP
jgi:hypothetical protein